MKKYIIIGVIVVVLIALAKILSPHVPAANNILLADKCPATTQKILSKKGKASDILLVPKLSLANKQLYNFSFIYPVAGWFANENFIQHNIYQLAYPQIAYSVNFSTPFQQTDPTAVDAGEKASIEFMVFPSYCEGNEQWYALLPDKSSFTKEYITVDGVQGIQASTTHMHNITYVLFNKWNWHYELMMEVAEKKDIPQYMQVLNTITTTFSHAQ